MTVSNSSDTTESTRTAGPASVLVRTRVRDPIAALEAASVDAGGGPVLGVLAVGTPARFERRLTGSGHGPETVHSVEFTPVRDPTGTTDSTDTTTPSDGEWVNGDVAGLSMKLVRRLEELAEEDGVVYIDSVEPLLDAVGLESAFRFFVIVATRARTAEVPLVARLDPGSVDPVAGETLAEAFDRTVEGPTDARDVDG